jgi:hypothetical protein
MDAWRAAGAWPWPRELDALIAAPDSHRLLLENDRVRVLEVVIEPGAREHRQLALPRPAHRAARRLSAPPTRISAAANLDRQLG